MKKHLTLLLLSAVLIGSCRKEPKTVPETEITEQENEQEADLVMFARKNASGDLFFTMKCRDGNIVGLTIDDNSAATIRKISSTDGSITWDMPVEPIQGYLSDIKEMADGSIWVSVNNFNAGTTVLAFSTTGASLWRKTYPLRMNEPHILMFKDGDILVVGNGMGKVLAMGLANNGDTLFTKTLNIPATWQIDDELVTRGGKILIAGSDPYDPQNFTALRNLHFLMLDRDLQLLREKTISEPGVSRGLQKCVESDNGDILCAGQQPPYPNYKDGFVMRLSSTLEEIHTDVFSNDSIAVKLYDIVATRNGYAVAGAVGHSSSTGEYSFIATSETATNKKQQKVFPRASGNYYEYINGVYSNGSGYLLVGTGYTNFAYNHFIVTLDKGLNGEW